MEPERRLSAEVSLRGKKTAEAGEVSLPQY